MTDAQATALTAAVLLTALDQHHEPCRTEREAIATAEHLQYVAQERINRRCAANWPPPQAEKEAEA